MPSGDAEWLVTDPQGAFAMGTASGIRTRRYHGFYNGIAGRSQTAYLVDLEFECQGVSLWPHLYLSPQGPLQNPEPENIGIRPIFQDSPSGPSWTWTLQSGQLTFRVVPMQPAGISVRWEWATTTQSVALLKVRGFWAMRDLHGLGGVAWSWKSLDLQGTCQGTLASLGDTKEGFCLFQGNWEWSDDPLWYENFYYSEEVERGYSGQENLYSAGFLQIHLKSGESCSWVNSLDPGVFDLCQGAQVDLRPRSRLFDFILQSPAGVVAGFPWFGEWGRDTFVTLPGIAAAWVELEAASGEFKNSVPWIGELMERWGGWIKSVGSLPNVLEQEGKAQWDSCDATLWWCHALAALWSYTLVFPKFYPLFRLEFKPLLEAAIQSIRTGRHPFLRVLDSGLIEVTGAAKNGHTTWMDARINAQAVTPRLGLLPEINALWFQALVLNDIWGQQGFTFDIASLGKRVLACREDSRPNFVFMHSIPLAPSFVLSSLGWEGGEVLESDLTLLGDLFWTPVGLRTLSPQNPSYRPRYKGHPTERDAAYHQGPVWPWLGGQFMVACDRLSRTRSSKHAGAMAVAPAVLRAKTLPPTVLKQMPILGHISELFDSLPPFVARGAPAQAWSLACFEEAQARRRWSVDQKMSEVLAQDKARGSIG